MISRAASNVTTIDTSRRSAAVVFTPVLGKIRLYNELYNSISLVRGDSTLRGAYGERGRPRHQPQAKRPIPLRPP